MRNHRPIPAWRQRQIRERNAELDERYHGGRTTLVGLGTQDPNDVAAWSKSLVRVLFSRGEYFCLDCHHEAGPRAIAMSTEPDTPCAACGRRVDEAQALDGGRQ